MTDKILNEQSREYIYPDGMKHRVHKAVAMSSYPDGDGHRWHSIVEASGCIHEVAPGWRILQITPIREDAQEFLGARK